MKKNDVRGLVAVVIVLIVFQILAFVLPFVHSSTFWWSYAFATVAILMQIPLLYLAFRKEQTPKSRFYGFPIAQVGAVYLAVQIVVSFVCMILAKWVPDWVAALIDVIILAAACLGLIATDALRDEVERQDEKLTTDVARMRELQSKMEFMVGQCTGAEAAKAVQKLAEEFRYSDPVSSEALRESELNLSAAVDELQAAVMDGNDTVIGQLCKTASAALAERNRLCKLNKGG